MSARDQTEHGGGGRHQGERLSPESESRRLRRRLTFWRSTAWLLAGVVVIAGFVAWERGNIRRRDCRVALLHYAKLAESSRLAAEPPELLELEWQHLDAGSMHLSPSHYVLLVPNWPRAPHGEERSPLAICVDPHSLLFTRGRHVLYRDAEGYHVEWLSEEQAAPLLLQIQQGR